MNVLRGNIAGAKRRVIGWTLMVLGLLTAGMWVLSGWTLVCVDVGKLEVWSARGEFSVLAFTRFHDGWHKSDLNVSSYERRHTYWLGFGRDERYDFDRSYNYGLIQRRLISPGPERVKLTIVYWPAPILLCGLGAWALRSGTVARSRWMMGKCSRCGYMLAGLAEDSTCPECGKKKPGPAARFARTA